MTRPFGISVLLPCYNRDCSAQVEILCRQLRLLAYEGVAGEVVVLEDGSENLALVKSNADACQRLGARHVILQENVGRAAVRNRLMDEACYAWMLLMDCDLFPTSEHFLKNYLLCIREIGEGQVVCGGLMNVKPAFPCLRYDYEQATSKQHTLEARRKQPYASLSTANLLLYYKVMEEVRFDDRFRGYGYEDVMFGRQLRLQAIPILHIDNPVEIRSFESNAVYMRKTEEAMRTLFRFRQELHDDVRMLQRLDRLKRYVPFFLLQLLGRLLLPLLKYHLSGKRAYWRFFNPYKLLYYVRL